MFSIDFNSLQVFPRLQLVDVYPQARLLAPAYPRLLLITRFLALTTGSTFSPAFHYLPPKWLACDCSSLNVTSFTRRTLHRKHSENYSSDRINLSDAGPKVCRGAEPQPFKLRAATSLILHISDLVYMLTCTWTYKVADTFTAKLKVFSPSGVRVKNCENSCSLYDDRGDNCIAWRRKRPLTSFSSDDTENSVDQKRTKLNITSVKPWG